MVDFQFDCLDIQAEPFSAAPSLLMRLRITEPSGARVDALALRCQVRIEPGGRQYSPDEADRLHDVFGERSRWAESLQPLQLANLSTTVPGFTGDTEVEIALPCSYDLEVAATKYFHGLENGEIPLLLLFSGSAFVSDGGRLQVHQVPWSKERGYRLPVAVWKGMIEEHFPGSGWVRLGRETLNALQRYRSRHALTSWDSTMDALLAEAEPE